MGIISDLLKTIFTGHNYFRRDVFGSSWNNGHRVSQNNDGSYNAHSGEQVEREVLSGHTPEGDKSYTVIKTKNGTFRIKTEDWDKLKK